MQLALKCHLASPAVAAACATPPVRACRDAARPTGLAVAAAGWLLVLAATAQADAQIRLPESALAAPIAVSADLGATWTEGVYEVWVLRGNCRVRQGTDVAAAREAVLWIDRTQSIEKGRAKVIAYLEGGVTIDFNHNQSRTQLTDNEWLGRFYTDADVTVHAAQTTPPPEPMPAVYEHAMARRGEAAAGRVRPAQFELPETVPPPTAENLGPSGMRQIRIYSRSSVKANLEWRHDPATQQWIGIVTSGVNIIVEGLGPVGPVGDVGTIDVSTDRLVIWMSGRLDPSQLSQSPQPGDIPLEIYMEGNVEFRQGERKITADRMFYDVANQVGMVLDAELLTPVPTYEGKLRLEAEVLQQTGPGRFLASDAFITSSRMGRPGYRIQANEITFEDTGRPIFDPVTGTEVRDPETGKPLVDHEYLATSAGNAIYLGDVPVFYWPYLATDLSQSSFLIRRARLKNDSVFGFQVLTDWNAYQLLGIDDPPVGTDWTASFDYLSDRGFGHGTTMAYDRGGFLGLSGPASGLADYWGIFDDGLDNLGRNRRDLEPEKHYRWRLFWQHRQMLAGDYELRAEVGWISDRNFLEQYYEREWDELKDEDTSLMLSHTRDNRSWSLFAQVRVNEFFTQTDWLPRGDHFWLGEPLVGDTFTWYEHSQAAYARFNTATAPEDPRFAPNTFHYLPWETGPGGAPLVGIEGERLVTRQEIDWPFQMGVVKVVPYALGELAHWGEDRSGDDLQRAYGQLGLRASLPMWRVDPAIQSRLFNVNGIAHKVVFDADFSWSEANRDLSDLPLYDPLDGDSIEAFRRRFLAVSMLPQFDERYYALRAGMGGWVTSPVTEIADDLLAMRLGMRHRWQTKRGAPGHQRIIDWVVLDTNAVWFPEAERDNFGKALGLVDYDFRWHVGDRLTMVSAGDFDFFDRGQQLVTIGGFLERPPRGSLYLGFHSLKGPIDSNVVSAAYTYRMSPKWVSSFGMSVDLGSQGNIGQNFSIVRIGESLLFSAGATVDASKRNVGFHFAVEPRFLPKTRLGRAGGAQIPVAGAYGLE